MSKNLNILVASMTGTALIVADEIAEICDSNNIKAKITEMDNLHYKSIIEQEFPILIISSTYGQGDIPDGSKVFYNNLKVDAPNLDHINFAVFGLGDMTYKDTFAFGGKKFEQLFLDLNANKIIESFFHDASIGTLPEEEGVNWFTEKLLKVL